MAFSLPRLKFDLSIAEPSNGKPTRAFMSFINEQVLNTIEAALRAQEQTIADLADIVAGLQAANTVAQAAQQAANVAQETADAAGGGTAVSGSATDPAVDLIGSGWVIGPQVNLTGVSAGTLTISGSGPQQDDDVTLSGSKGAMQCQFRVVEVVGGVDTVVYSTGAFTIFTLNDGSPASVNNASASEVSAFSMARSTTGAVSYRIDAKGTGARDAMSLMLYVYARRS